MICYMMCVVPGGYSRTGIGRYSESDKILLELDNVILMANDGFVFWLCFVTHKDVIKVSPYRSHSSTFTPYQG